MKRERILITNDDGINSKGLRALINVAREFGDVVVVAPEQGMSGMSHSITMYNPLFIRTLKIEDDLKVYACEGTPVDCVKVAIDALMPEPPTLVLSGINHGANTNMSVIYSGTMGAAREGSTYNIPSIGLSHISHDVNKDLTVAMHYTREVIKAVLANDRPEYLCLNVNVPDLPMNEIKGVKFCRQAMGHWVEDFDKKSDPRGREYYWLVGSFRNRDKDATDTDEWAVNNGYVSIVPILQDVTNYSTLDCISHWDL